MRRFLDTLVSVGRVPLQTSEHLIHLPEQAFRSHRLDEVCIFCKVGQVGGSMRTETGELCTTFHHFLVALAVRSLEIAFLGPIIQEDRSQRSERPPLDALPLVRSKATFRRDIRCCFDSFF